MGNVELQSRLHQGSGHSALEKLKWLSAKELQRLSPASSLLSSIGLLNRIVEELFVKARDFIKSDEKVLVVFTNGTDLTFQQDGNTGSTGEWAINPERLIDRVIIYQRNSGTNTNTLHIANCVRIEPAERSGRYNIELNHVQYIGTTSANWVEFADGGPNPIRYLP